MLKTLAGKHGSTVTKMAARYKAEIGTPHRLRTCLQVSVNHESRTPLTARFGGIPLKRQKTAVLADRQPPPVDTHRKDLITRLLAGRCEMCALTGEVDVHHIGKLARLGKPEHSRPKWTELMAHKQRKTLVVCTACHDTIHARQPPVTPRTEQSPEGPGASESGHVRFGRGPSGKRTSPAGTSRCSVYQG